MRLVLVVLAATLVLVLCPCRPAAGETLPPAHPAAGEAPAETEAPAASNSGGPVPAAVSWAVRDPQTGRFVTPPPGARSDERRRVAAALRRRSEPVEVPVDTPAGGVRARLGPGFGTLLVATRRLDGSLDIHCAPAEPLAVPGEEIREVVEGPAAGELTRQNPEPGQ